MKKWLRRIRGALGTALTWAVGWGVVGAITGVLEVVLGGDPVAAIPVVAGWVGASFGLAGFIGGAIFSTVLGVVEGRRSFDQMSLPRLALWGGVGGVLVGALLVANGAAIGLFSAITIALLPLLAAGSAAGSLALARRAEDKELLEAGEEALGLTEGA